MTPQVPQSKDELESHLKDQVAFLRLSADSYDAGFDGEAKRLALALRILLHDKGQSHSLLGQLARLSASFIDTAIPHNPKNLGTHGGLLMVAAAGRATKYIAPLSEGPYRRWTSFPDWWAEPVFVDDERKVLSRRDLVLSVADQDGGAHVDPALSETYSRLSRSNSLGWVTKIGTEVIPIRPPERAAIRQIAHEVLRTLDPAYSKVVKHDAQMLFGGAMMVQGTAADLGDWRSPPPPERNDRCPCGSGKKYKKCHGFAV